MASKKGGGGNDRDKYKVIDGNVLVPKETQQEGRKCAARARVCMCGHRFAPAAEKVSRAKESREVALRRKPGYDMSKLGSCPECGRPRRLCDKAPAVDKNVCYFHGGAKGSGGRPLIPINALDDETLEAVAALQRAKDSSLDQEFYFLKHIIQRAIGKFDSEAPDVLGFAERLTALYDRAVGIQVRQAQLRLLVPPGDSNITINFDDPRVAVMLKERMRTQVENTMKGMLALMVESAIAAGMIIPFSQMLPDRLRSYEVVQKAIKDATPVETEAVTTDGDDGDDDTATSE